MHRLLSFLPSSRHRPTSHERAVQMSMYLGADTMEGFYRAQMSLWKLPSRLVRGGVEPRTLLTDSNSRLRHGQLFDRMMYADAMSYMPDDILVKVDRAAMGVSLETRVPILDHRVIEFAWRLPLGMKIRDGEGKFLLRQVLHRYVPRELVDRPKAGFAVPLETWLREDLRDWAEEMLSPQRLDADGFFATGVVRAYWRKYVEGNDYLSLPMWQILGFQAWLRALESDAGGAVAASTPHRLGGQTSSSRSETESPTNVAVARDE
jgi:asparagine synthase (glutamine-hydrolysing)